MKYPFLDLGTVNRRYAADLHEAARRVIESGRYIGGDEVRSFNARMAALCESPFCIGTSNGLDALRLIFEGYKAIGRLKAGDEVIVPSNTYIATMLAITHAGLTPVPVDPDYASMNLTAGGIERAITRRTRAFVTVHLYGRVAWDDDMADMARRHGLIAVEDAAQSIGARATAPGLHGSRKAGALGDAAAFSFYPTKNIGALGDAGAVTTHDEALAKAVEALANYGSDRRYHNIYAGFNCRLDPLQAAMLKVKLKDTDDGNARRFGRAVIYNRHITHPDIIKPLLGSHPTECVWHQYVVRIGGNRRDRLREYLTANGVGTDIHYPEPPHRQPCYASLRHRELPVAERLASEVLSLPISDCTSEKDVMEISEIINGFKPTD